MKSLQEHLTESLAKSKTQNIDESLSKESVIVAAIILAASFCVPNALGLIWQLGKYGFKLINRKKFLEELPELTAKEKERILELTKDMKGRGGPFIEYLERIENAETPEEIIRTIEEFRDRLKDTVWDPSVAGWTGTEEWANIKKKTELIYDRSKEMSEKSDKKLRLKWTVDPLDWLMFVASIGVASGGSHRHGGSRGSGSFGGGRSGGGGFSGRW